MVEVSVFKIAGVRMAGRASSPQWLAGALVAGTAIRAANRGVVEVSVAEIACV